MRLNGEGRFQGQPQRTGGVPHHPAQGVLQAYSTSASLMSHPRVTFANTGMLGRGYACGQGLWMAKYEDTCSALAIALSAGAPVLLWGGPGVGKTSVIEQIAGLHGWHLETVIASICDPKDFKGMPREGSSGSWRSLVGWMTSGFLRAIGSRH